MMKPFYFIAVASAFIAFQTAHAEPKPSSVGPAVASVLPPLSQRFADDGVQAAPDFQKHVMPLLGRLGCNGRACHGSFQGRGGFQLSLFGYDFHADHKALLDPATGRVDVDDIEESLILAKPVDADMHEGGKLLDPATWQFRVLKNWVKAGGSFSGKLQSLTKLEVLPAEVRFDGDDQSVQVQAIAHWADGTSEDVTELCRFNSNDDGVAEINADGLISSGVFGDTHVVVSYDRAVVPVPVMRAVSTIGRPESPAVSNHPIDRLIQTKLDKLNIVPSPLCSDEEFIRRASLDITGTLPSSVDVRAFLADSSTNKREKLINELLDAPGYAAWWATRLSDWTGNSEAQLNNALPVRTAGTRLWYEWLRVRLDENVPYDEIVEGIVTAQSRSEDETYREYCESMTQACQPGNEAMFAARDGMPLYWARRNFAKPEDRAIGFAYTFLGVRIECAQCHKHPFDQWSKDDFDQFAKLFTGIRAQQNNVQPESQATYKELMNELTGGKKIDNGELRKRIYEIARKGGTVPFFELSYDVSRQLNAERKKQKEMERKGKKVAMTIPSATILGQDHTINLDEDPRGELMDWLRDPANPYFARAIVNRVWSNYFGMGIIDPTDDMNLANPPSNAPLLDALSREFIEHGYDLKWLSRTITTSHAYQRSMLTNASNESDRINFSHHIPRRYPAEVIHDAVLLATESTKDATKMREQLDSMAIANSLPVARNNANYVMTVFGQSSRESNCDCDRSDSPSLLQSIYLRNDFEMIKQLGDKDGWVAQICGQMGTGDASPLLRRQAEQRADQFRSQIKSRLAKFQRLDEKQKVIMQRKLHEEIVRINGKLKPTGYQLPGVDEIMKNPEGWQLIAPPAAPVVKSEKIELTDIIDEAYLRTLSRFADADEKKIASEFIEQSESTVDGVTSLLWALVNTKEFIISH